MTDYKTLHGKKIKYLASDPPGPAGEGQVWYNSTATEFKSSVKVSAWAAGGNLNTARRQTTAVGTQTASLCINGFTDATVAICEEYDGSSWTESGDTSNAKRLHGSAGTQTAALSFGGAPAITASNIWDGSSWSSTPAMATGVGFHGGCGTTVAALQCGGGPPGDNVATTQEFTEAATTRTVDVS